MEKRLRLRIKTKARFSIDDDGRVWEAPESKAVSLDVLAIVPVNSRGKADLNRAFLYDASSLEDSADIDSIDPASLPVLQHPHVSSSGIFCPGATSVVEEEEAAEALRRLLSAVNTESVMRRPDHFMAFFVPQGHGFRLLAHPWIGILCDRCEEAPGVVRCARCGARVCEYCADFCSDCERDICPNCRASGDWVCLDCEESMWKDDEGEDEEDEEGW